MFKDLCLKKSNYLLNVESKKKTYLTETEFSILKLLLQEKKIKKEKLRIDILELRSSVETKSLESHLSRIRKKINEIDSCVSISSPGNNQVAIF
jgi:DNA-binding response OmpR family regulator